MRKVKDVRFRQPGRLSHIRRGQTTRFRHSHDGNGPDIVDKSVFSCVLVSARLSGELTLKADSSTVERLYLTQRRLYGSIPAPPTIPRRKATNSATASTALGIATARTRLPSSLQYRCHCRGPAPILSPKMCRCGGNEWRPSPARTSTNTHWQSPDGGPGTNKSPGPCPPRAPQRTGSPQSAPATPEPRSVSFRFRSAPIPLRAGNSLASAAPGHTDRKSTRL